MLVVHSFDRRDRVPFRLVGRHRIQAEELLGVDGDEAGAQLQPVQTRQGKVGFGKPVHIRGMGIGLQNLVVEHHVQYVRRFPVGGIEHRRVDELAGLVQPRIHRHSLAVTEVFGVLLPNGRIYTVSN